MTACRDRSASVVTAGEIELVFVKCCQRGTMPDADQRGVRQALAKQAVQSPFARFIERRGRLSRNSQSGRWRSARKRKTLLLARRKQQRPIGGLVQTPEEIGQSARVEYLAQLAVVERRARRRIAKRVAQRTDRKIRALRQEQHARALRQFDSAVSETPDSCDRSHEVLLPVPVEPVISHRSPGRSDTSMLQTRRSPSGNETVTSSRSTESAGCDTRVIPGAAARVFAATIAAWNPVKRSTVAFHCANVA